MKTPRLPIPLLRNPARSVHGLLILLFAITPSPRAASQEIGSILYSAFLPGPTGLQTRVGQIQSDGSADQLLDVALPAPLFPNVSRDGQWLALTANDPLRPAKISPDVFVIDRRTGRIDKLTSFEDSAHPNGFLVTVPLWKAFSPDAQRLAVAGFLYMGARATLVYTNELGQAVGPSQPLSGVLSAPALAVYHTSGAPPTAVDLGDASDQDLSHRGEGVDWSPIAEELAYPRTFPSVTQTGAPLFLTAIHLLRPPPPGGALTTLRITSPPAVSGVAPVDSFVTAWADDFFPAYSPNGRGIAYVRAYSVFTFSGLDLSTPSIRIVGLDGSGDFEVLRLPKGTYITRVAWSPDGNQLVFDLGLQAVVGGFPAKSANPFTLELYRVNVDGTQLTRIRTPSGAHPVWLPATPPPPPRIPIVERLAPTSAVAGSDAFDLAVQGSQFVPGSVVRWDDVDLVTTALSEFNLVARVPAAFLSHAGPHQVRVVNPGPDGGISESAVFTIVKSPPADPRLPALNIVRGPASTLVVSWPETSGAVLELTRSLTPPVEWTEARETPITEDGQTHVSLAADGASRFIRLRRPD